MRNLLSLLFILSSVVGQINDKNFKSEINGGVVVAVFTSEWQEDAKKVVKKLRLRNFPSMVLFYDGSKKETWKGDMDGELDIDSKGIKSAIDDILSEDVF